MLFHIVFGQFDADGETLDDEDDSRELEGDLIGVSPCSRVDQVGGMRAKDDSADGRDSCFTYVQSFLDERRTQHEQRCEAAEDDVDQMRSIDREMFPRHGESRAWCLLVMLEFLVSQNSRRRR